ncbi:uncharacterized protein LOC122817622 isoform X2 [Protopterus annectens]|uniref:uncharacterized protein LOC122817622 isoform X2 n=1 Tax=Protopterus annectens TaxID=7888 RepID=UPI001CF9B705|nr:uncharacterized protein LOC122817622 isoform X2 [Protopterus annectens]
MSYKMSNSVEKLATQPLTVQDCDQSKGETTYCSSADKFGVSRQCAPKASWKKWIPRVLLVLILLGVIAVLVVLIFHPLCVRSCLTQQLETFKNTTVVRVGELNSSLAFCLSNTDFLQQNITILGNELAILQNEKSFLKEKNAVLSRNVTALKDEVTALQLDNLNLTETTAMLQSNVTALKDEVTALQLSSLNLTETTAMLQNELKEWKAKFSDASQQLEHYKNKTQDYSKEVRRLNQEAYSPAGSGSRSYHHTYPTLAAGAILIVLFCA